MMTENEVLVNKGVDVQGGGSKQQKTQFFTVAYLLQNCLVARPTTI